MKTLLALLVALVLSPFAEANEIARVEDGHKNYVTAFGGVPDNVINEVREAYPDAHYRQIAATDPVANRYKSYVEFPSIVVQDATGKVLYKKSEFGDGRCGPFRPCPTPEPKPEPPAAEPPVLIEPIPDTPVPDTEDPNVLATVLVAAAGAAGGAGRKVYSEMKG